MLHVNWCYLSTSLTQIYTYILTQVPCGSNGCCFQLNIYSFLHTQKNHHKNYVTQKKSYLISTKSLTGETRYTAHWFRELTQRSLTIILYFLSEVSRVIYIHFNNLIPSYNLFCSINAPTEVQSHWFFFPLLVPLF